MDFTPNELTFVRQALDLVSIKGTDAKFLANLQTKIEEELINLQKIAEEEAEKAFALLQKKSGEIKLENQNISDTQAEKYLSDFEKEREAIEEIDKSKV
jgi:hypothetical protein